MFEGRGVVSFFELTFDFLLACLFIQWCVLIIDAFNAVVVEAGVIWVIL